jgi:hypothetical protein
MSGPNGPFLVDHERGAWARQRTSVTPAPPASNRLVWMSLSCCSSDMGAASTPNGQMAGMYHGSRQRAGSATAPRNKGRAPDGCITSHCFHGAGHRGSLPGENEVSHSVRGHRHAAPQVACAQASSVLEPDTRTRSSRCRCCDTQAEARRLPVRELPLTISDSPAPADAGNLPGRHVVSRPRGRV